MFSADRRSGYQLALAKYELPLIPEYNIELPYKAKVEIVVMTKLCSVDINSFQLGIEAASQMINHIANPNLMATKIIVPHYLVERESCIPINTTEDI